MSFPEGVKVIKGDYENVRARMNREDVIYQRKDGRNLRIRFVYPQQDNTERKYPLLMHIQGSAWREQNLNDHILDFKDIVTAGYVLAVVEYLPVPYGTFPSQIEDAKTAMRYIVEHADEHQVDTENLFISGDSSGGHTALMCWATWGSSQLDTSSDPLPMIQGVVDLYGVVDLLTFDEDNPRDIEDHAATPEAQLLGGYIPSEHPEKAEKASVLNYIDEKTDNAPLLILHGTKDSLVGFNQSVRLYEKAKEVNKDVTFYAIEGGEHGKSIFYNKEAMQVIVDFLNTNKTTNYNWF